MDKNEDHIDKVLDDIISIHQAKEKIRQSYYLSTYIRSLSEFDRGDRVSMTLFPVAINGYLLEEEREIEGTLVVPSLALVKIHIADGVEPWQGRTVGFATRTPECFKDKICKYTVAAKQEVAYFYEEDIETGRVGNLYLPDDDDKLHHIPLTYGRVAVGGSVIFDYRPKRYKNR